RWPTRPATRHGDKDARRPRTPLRRVAPVVAAWSRADASLTGEGGESRSKSPAGWPDSPQCLSPAQSRTIRRSHSLKSDVADTQHPAGALRALNLPEAPTTKRKQ